MARILVTGAYTAEGSFQLFFAETGDDYRTGDLYQEITPNQVFGIGNSLGGWWAKPTTSAGEARISLVRISGSERDLSLAQIQGRCRNRRGFILQPGLTGLWATSSGAARNGLLHRVNPAEVDPLKAVLRRHGMSTRDIIHQVDSLVQPTRVEGAGFEETRILEKLGWACRFGGIDKGGYTSLSWFLTDGTWGERTLQDEEKVYFPKGGTFLIKGGDANNGSEWSSRPWLGDIFLTPEADRGLIAQAVDLIMGRSSALRTNIHTVELTLQIRCQCGKPRCTPSLHY